MQLNVQRKASMSNNADQNTQQKVAQSYIQLSASLRMLTTTNTIHEQLLNLNHHNNYMYILINTSAYS